MSGHLHTGGMQSLECRVQNADLLANEVLLRNLHFARKSEIDLPSAFCTLHSEIGWLSANRALVLSHLQHVGLFMGDLSESDIDGFDGAVRLGER